MVFCMIVGCGTKTIKGKRIYFASLPSIVTNQGEQAKELSEERRSRWISAISRDDLTDKILENDRVCEKHFASGRAAKCWDKYNIDWVPSLLLGHTKNTTKSNVETAAKRGERVRIREQKRSSEAACNDREDEIASKRKKLNEPGIQVEELDFGSNDNEQEQEEPAQKEVETQTDGAERQTTSTQTDEFEYLFNSLTLDEKPFDRSEFQNDDDKVCFYTGLPSFDILNTVFKHVSPHVSRKSQSLTQFQEFAMTLMKLKLNMPLQDLSYRFSVSLSTVSRIYSAWMVALDVRLSPLIYWPDREELWYTMPQCFQLSFGNKSTVIIDCFEVFINRPSNLYARAQTFSSYKHHNTVKILIGITPQGSISFVSKAWGGRTSDKFLTENCGMLDKLLPGDLVLADRGFTIQESLMFRRAELAIPAFTRGKDQLDPVDIESTRGIANVRIHVERVIGRLRRKYTIFSGILPIDFLQCKPNGSQEEATPMIDRIIIVCAALVNVCPGIVSFD